MLVLGVMVLVPTAQATAAPTVTIDDVSDTIVGSADTGTDVTWHADEVGTYSVRVGIPGWPPPESTNCTTGLEVASGVYIEAPAQRTTSVNASDLSESLNRIQVCVTDAIGNVSSEAIYVVKDLTAPTVAVDSVSDPVVGPSRPDTEVTWHADESGAYSVRVGGTSCATGTEVASGYYVTAPVAKGYDVRISQQLAITVSTSDLGDGANTILVCV